MDAENLIKWKEEFQTERKKQATKVRGLQKETAMRRKAMEMKAQIEAAKEEKRRKEALAERKAQHMEATMRFQKGIKNFKIKKEKVSLDEVLKQMGPVRSRLNSAESDRTRFQHNELAGYYCVNKKPVSAVKRSSSFDSAAPKSAPASYRLNNFNIEQFNSTAPSNFSPNFRHAITENQKQIHEMNREALREFQDLIKNEVSHGNQTNMNSYASNFVYPMHQKFTNILPQGEVKKESETYSEVGTILTVDDDPNSDDERDSLDTDSLLNARVESPIFPKQTSDKQTGQDNVFIPIKTETNFNNYFNLNLQAKTEKQAPPPPPPVVKQALSSQPNANVARKPGKQIKSILKRSCSLDNASLVISGVTKTASCFKSDKIIKDSIELANDRLNAVNNEPDSSRKKSVRFANDQESAQVVVQAAKMDKPENKQEITSQNNSNSNEASTRISSTNSIRRPIIKPRNTSQIKQQQINCVLDQKNSTNENSKPPLPNGQSGYSALNNKRREFFQRNRLLGDKQTVKSAKSATSPSPVPNQDSNFIPNQPEEPKNNSPNDRIFRQVVYNFQDFQTKQTPPSTITPNTPGRPNDSNFKELPINVIKNDLDKNYNNSPNGNFTSPKALNQNMAQQFVQRNQFPPQDKVVMLNTNDQYGFRRHFGFAPNSRPVQDNSSARLAYLNSIQQQRQSQSGSAPRVLSADSLNRNQTIQLDIKYPFYSNFQNQNNHFNVKPVRGNFSQEQPNSAKEVLDSMALFLKAEDMSNKNYSESQIINTVHNATAKNQPKQNMTSLSLEEQRIKSSLMRLDERYNFLKTHHHQTRYNHEDVNGRRFNVMNKYQRPMSTNVIRYRK